MLFRVVKRYYDIKIYSKDNVKVFVRANKITPEEYKLITNEVYTA